MTVIEQSAGSEKVTIWVVVGAMVSLFVVLSQPVWRGAFDKTFRAAYYDDKTIKGANMPELYDGNYAERYETKPTPSQLTGEKVWIKRGPYDGHWGIVRAYIAKKYHVALWDGRTSIVLGRKNLYHPLITKEPKVDAHA